MKHPDVPTKRSADAYLAGGEQLAAGLPALLVAAERVAASVAQGVHGRRRVGQGESFWQYRAFQMGDASAQVDWRRSARSDSLYVRETEWEAAQTVSLWLDSSASMQFRSSLSLPSKWERAVTLTLALSMLCMQSGERVGTVDGLCKPALGRQALYQLAEVLSRTPDSDSRNSLPDVGHLPAHGQVVLISDFLSSLEELLDTLSDVAQRRMRALLWVVYDPAEESLPYRGRVRFSGMEGEGNVLVRKVQALRGAYREKRQAHFETLRGLVRKHGWYWLDHSTAATPESALLMAYSALSGEFERERYHGI